MANTTFVSPGVYTSEVDLTFVTRQVGVTTLGLVGETTIGPAFQPIFISNYGEFQSFFGGLNNTLVKDTGYPKYELPYVAKSYLSQSNQLFVTRVLGFSGFDGGLAWGITLDAALDPSTSAVTVSAVPYNPLISYTATSAGTNVTLVSSDSFIQTLINDGTLTDTLAYLGSSVVSPNPVDVPQTYIKIGTTFSGVSFSLETIAQGTTVGGEITGVTSGISVHYSGTGFSDVENQLVALLRSRATVYGPTQEINFEVTGSTGLVFDPTASGATTDPLGNFSISGVSTLQGSFNYDLSMDYRKKNYLPKVLGRDAQDGKTAIFVEELYDHMFNTDSTAGKIRGIKPTIVNYNRTKRNF
jgi:hypothetical protein